MLEELDKSIHRQRLHIERLKNELDEAMRTKDAIGALIIKGELARARLDLQEMLEDRKSLPDAS